LEGEQLGGQRHGKDGQKDIEGGGTVWGDAHNGTTRSFRKIAAKKTVEGKRKEGKRIVEVTMACGAKPP